MSEPPKLADTYYLRVGVSLAEHHPHVPTFHVWDLAGYVASTQDVHELREWLLYQQAVGSTAPCGYGALRERFFPGTYEQKLSDLVSQGSSRSTPMLRRERKERKASTPKPTITSAGELLAKLGLKK